MIYTQYYVPDDKALMTGLHRQVRSGQLEYLTNEECINEYAQTYQMKRSDVVIVSQPNKEDKNDVLYFTKIVPVSGWGSGCALDSFGWICPNPTCAKPCRQLLPEVRSNLSHWRPVYAEQVARYCLSKKMPERCRLNYTVWLATGVLATNLIMGIAVFTVLFKFSRMTPILTLGDAIVSFLAQPDPTTKGYCMLSRDRASQRLATGSGHPQHYTPAPRRFYAVASKGHWITAVSLYGLAIAVTCSLLGYGLAHLPGEVNTHTLWGIGLGAVHEYNILDMELGFYVPQNVSKGLISYILISNMPQLIMSILYFSYNSLFTRMIGAVEWNGFAHERKGIRVSLAPEGAQRSRYFLQLPYRYSAPLLIVSTAMHWMISQSLFVVAVQRFSPRYRKAYESFSLVACAYSPLALIMVIILAVGLVAALLVTGARRFRSGMPVAATCSMAIAAACHPCEGASSPASSKEPVKWGVMGVVQSEGKAYAHCGFSSGLVRKPDPTTLYL